MSDQNDIQLRPRPDSLPATSPLHRLLSHEFLRYLGPGFLVTVGFIDPGNWATNIAGGADFNYSLLWVITLSTLMLIVLQHLAAKLGIVTGRSLAVNVRSYFPRPLSNLFGISIILASAATDLAEYLGAALGFSLLFGIPVLLGAPITVVLVIAAILGQKYHTLERMIIVFLAIIAACYVVELFIVQPDWAAALPSIVVPEVHADSIVVAMAMLGAVVMPHNIYLHSNVIQSREWGKDEAAKRRLIRFSFGDTVLAMGAGWIVNSAMIIVAAAVFFRHGISVGSIEQASETLRPLAGPLAQFAFGVALLFAGIGSSITSSMAEANVVTGFLGHPEDPHSTIYRVGLIVTSVPAMLVIAMNFNTYKLLILSQVVLSLQLPLTIIPLLILARSGKVMGKFRSGNIEISVGWLIALVVIGLNGLLLYQTFGGQF
ncbi:MAG: hypothetical protein GXP41_04870 [Chloroflexi bacterium]|nr:hypothetical protein [Chloroflexota bacterium]